MAIDSAKEQFYCQDETWDIAIEKLHFWIRDYLGFADLKFHKYIQENNYLPIISDLHGNASRVQVSHSIQIAAFAAGGDLHSINFTISSMNCGWVEVSDSRKVKGFFPLRDLSSFSSIKEASDWLKENPSFYNPSWDKFIEKVDSNE